jgi:hypothetical protein
MGAPYINLLVWTLGVAKGVLGLPPHPLRSVNAAKPMIAMKCIKGTEGIEAMEATEDLKDPKRWRP